MSFTDSMTVHGGVFLDVSALLELPWVGIVENTFTFTWVWFSVRFPALAPLSPVQITMQCGL
jgi:hypothetical protein